jgi:hypothetical protein
MANKSMKKCSASLAIKEMQVKMTLRFHPSPVRMATINNTNNNCCEGVWKKEHFYTVGGNAD